MQDEKRPTYRQENLLQSSDSPFIPVGVVIDGVSVASNQMLRQNHNKSLQEMQYSFNNWVSLIYRFF